MNLIPFLPRTWYIHTRGWNSIALLQKMRNTHHFVSFSRPVLQQQSSVIETSQQLKFCRLAPHSTSLASAQASFSIATPDHAHTRTLLTTPHQTAPRPLADGSKMSCFGPVVSYLFGRNEVVNGRTYRVVRRVGEGGMNIHDIKSRSIRIVLLSIT